jgi:putative membrane-bound dehydrogenase-like protein
LSTQESAKSFRQPPGYRIDLIAAEPVVREPSGVCWDEHGRLYICELHGYNLEGQYDIEELNKTGRLDREVRRIQANERARQAAKEGTYGTVKQLVDTDGDGKFDKAIVLADRLPPCYGICPARGGLIVACAPDIMYLADRDGDGAAEVREALFTGFATGALERGVNAPQWGPDNWIYFGRGHGGGRITGPHLAKPVELPNTDFRIKPDGSALEPVTGGTHTIGFTFTAEGERIVTNTQSPAIQVAPLPWAYLARNPNAAVGAIEHNAAPDGKVYPASRPHPWRTKRAQDPGFAKFYTDRYGIAESAPNGYFTSACSPLVYQDWAVANLTGHLLACEPAQNLIHRSTLVRDGLRLSLRRVASEEQAEFLTSTDPWFHPIALAHAPDGSISIVDFYREIIEDYSAIPRYLQQQYGLVNGREHGRLWRLSATDALSSSTPDLGRFTSAELVNEVAGQTHWRRQTARRLLIERSPRETAAALGPLLTRSTDPAIVLNVMYALDGLAALAPAQIENLVSHKEPSVRVHALRAAERWLNEDPRLVDKAMKLARDPQAQVRLQAALTLGEVRDDRVLAALATLAIEPDADRWLHQAVLSSVAGREGRLLTTLLDQSTADPPSLNRSRTFVSSLATTIAASRKPQELSKALARIASLDDAELQNAFLSGLLSGLKNANERIPLDNAAREALKSLATSDEKRVRDASRQLTVALRLENDDERRSRLAAAIRNLGDVQAPSKRRLTAVEELAIERDAATTHALIHAFAASTPQVQAAILKALFERKDRLATVISAVETDELPASALGALERRALLEHDDRDIRQRASKLFANAPLNDETFNRFASALQAPGDSKSGESVFRDKCATCHRAHGVGTAVGPDLTAEFQRSPETILKDILAPNDAIAAGYATYVVETMSGQVFSGVLAIESANSVTLRLAEGKEETVLRKDIERLASTQLSLMPENLAESLEPHDIADMIAWLSRSPKKPPVDR